MAKEGRDDKWEAVVICRLSYAFYQQDRDRAYWARAGGRLRNVFSASGISAEVISAAMACSGSGLAETIFEGKVS